MEQVKGEERDPDRPADPPPPDKETPENYTSEGGATPEGPVAIT